MEEGQATETNPHYDEVVLGAEAAIGLAIIVVYYRNRGSIRVENINGMKG